jgi:hypothetical protein
VLRSHLWEKEKWSYKAGDLLKEVQFMTFTTGDNIGTFDCIHEKQYRTMYATGRTNIASILYIKHDK